MKKIEKIEKIRKNRRPSRRRRSRRRSLLASGLQIWHVSTSNSDSTPKNPPMVQIIMSTLKI